jgi:hypothetical protein
MTWRFSSRGSKQSKQRSPWWFVFALEREKLRIEFKNVHNRLKKEKKKKKKVLRIAAA